jgi:hypothetical protein
MAFGRIRVAMGEAARQAKGDEGRDDGRAGETGEGSDGCWIEGARRSRIDDHLCRTMNLCVGLIENITSMPAGHFPGRFVQMKTVLFGWTLHPAKVGGPGDPFG